MSVRPYQSSHFGPHALSAVHQSVSPKVEVYVEALQLFQSLYVFFDGDIRQLESVVCNEQSFVRAKKKGLHKPLPRLKKDQEKALIKACDGIHQQLQKLSSQKVIDRDLTACENVLGDVRYVHDGFLSDAGLKSFP